MADVFFSYSPADRAVAERLAWVLRDAGLTVWLDPYLSGSERDDHIKAAEIQSASIVVVLWSAHSVRSEWVQREVKHALDKHVVSVFVERVEPQIQGGMHLAVDLSEWTGSADDPQFQRLVSGIRTRLELDPLILLDSHRTPPPASAPPPTSILPSDYDPFADDVPDRDVNTSKSTKDPIPPQRPVPPPPTSSPSPPRRRFPNIGTNDDPFIPSDPTIRRPRPTPDAAKDAVSPHRTMVAVNCPYVIGTAWQTIRAYLFPKAAEAEVADDARQLRDSGEAQHTSGQTNVSQIQLGTLITVIIDLPDIECHPQQRRFIWRGRWQKADFTVRYLGKQRRRQQGNVSWFAGIVCIAQLPLDVQLTDEYAKHPSSSTVTSPGYESVFVSYSTKDSTIVDWLETTYTALGMTYLRDVKALRSGETWDKQLLKLIEKADLFQLCWSANAKQSQYVSDEWRFALGMQKPNFIRPCYWEDPMPEPPPELKPLHFAKLKLNWVTRTWFSLRARFG